MLYIHNHSVAHAHTHIQGYIHTPNSIGRHNLDDPDATVSPTCRRCLFTRILLYPLVALIALHMAAPVELAAALPPPVQLMRVVAAAAAQQIAAVHAVRRPIAEAPIGAQRAETLVLLAVVGRVLQVHKVHAFRLRLGRLWLDHRPNGSTGMCLHSWRVIIILYLCFQRNRKLQLLPV